MMCSACFVLFNADFYQVDQLHLQTWMKYALMANPLYSLVSMFRSCVLFGEMWNMNWLYYSLGFASRFAPDWLLCIL